MSVASGQQSLTDVLFLVTFVAGTYPELDKAPDPNSDQVKQWLAELDLSKVPDLSVTNGSCAENPTEAADKSRCWWTCGQCVRETDITVSLASLAFVGVWLRLR